MGGHAGGRAIVPVEAGKAGQGRARQGRARQGMAGQGRAGLGGEERDVAPETAGLCLSALSTTVTGCSALFAKHLHTVGRSHGWFPTLSAVSSQLSSPGWEEGT